LLVAHARGKEESEPPRLDRNGRAPVAGLEAAPLTHG